MNRIMRCVLALMVAAMVNALPAYAERGGHSGYGGRGGHYGHGGGVVRFGVYLGPGMWWPGWWGPYRYYPYYPYYPPAVIVPPPSDLYVEPAPAPEAEEPRYWYYCREPKGFYPDVKRCPKGWLKVVPPENPSEEEEE